MGNQPRRGDDGKKNRPVAGPAVLFVSWASVFFKMLVVFVMMMGFGVLGLEGVFHRRAARPRFRRYHHERRADERRHRENQCQFFHNNNAPVSDDAPGVGMIDSEFTKWLHG